MIFSTAIKSIWRIKENTEKTEITEPTEVFQRFFRPFRYFRLFRILFRLYFYPINALSNSSNDAAGKASLARATSPVILATAKLIPVRLRSGGTPGIERG